MQAEALLRAPRHDPFVGLAGLAIPSNATGILVSLLAVLDSSILRGRLDVEKSQQRAET